MTLHEFLDLLVRWIHLIAGIMWIGNSMLFNWLDRNLLRRPGAPPAEEGEIWMLHSGGFYHVTKTQLAPNQLPDALHWFKWQNGLTWLSGISLLVIVYYFNDAAFLVDPQVKALGPNTAIALSVATLLIGYLTYDLLWRTLGAHNPRLATLILVSLLFAAVYGETQLFSGRAAYIHIGVLLGTIMTGNVWFVILPSQRSLVAATKAGAEQDKALGLRAKQRSIHNNYMTFPLLFIMLSNHFPGTWGNKLNYLVLIVLMIGGVGVRHFMNIRFASLDWASPAGWPRWLYPAAGIAIVSSIGVMALTARPKPVSAIGPPVPFSQAHNVVALRCVACHSAHPTEALFAAAPLGVMFDTPEQIRNMAARIKERAVVSKTMPFINRTGMTDEERTLLGRWIDQGAKLQ